MFGSRCKWSCRSIRGKNEGDFFPLFDLPRPPKDQVIGMTWHGMSVKKTWGFRFPFISQPLYRWHQLALHPFKVPGNRCFSFSFHSSHLSLPPRNQTPQWLHRPRLPSLKTKSLHLKMDGWNTNFLLWWPIFRGQLLVSGRVGKKFSTWNPGGWLQISYMKNGCFTKIIH